MWEGPVGGVLILEHSVAPVPGGKINSQLIEEAGFLEPGVYTLDAQAGTFMKNEVPPSRSAQASFDFTFDVSGAPCEGDTNGDGQVNVADLVAVILDWDTDGTANGGDVDGSGVVNVHDLVVVILAWGPC